MKNTLYILLILLIFSCREDYSNRNVEVIDIKNYEQREWKDLPKQIGDIDSLLLLENDSILLSQIDDIKFLNDKFYIRDWKNKQIVIFNNNGDFIASISKYGRGPSEYLDISDFDVDKQGNIYVIDGNKDNLIVYDYQGNSVRSEKLPFEIDLIKVVSPNNYLITISSWEEGEHKGKQIVSTDSLFNIIKTHSLYTQYYDDNMWLSSSYFKETENGVFFHRQINDSVYLFNNGNLDKIYLFDFGAQSIPLDDRKNVERLIESNDIDKYKTLLDFTIIGNDYIYGTMIEGRERNIFIASRKDKIIYKLPNGKFIGTTDNKIIQLDYLQEENTNNLKLILYNII